MSTQKETEINLYTTFVTWLVDNQVINESAEILQQELTLKVRDPSKNGARPFLEDVLCNLIK